MIDTGPQSRYPFMIDFAGASMSAKAILDLALTRSGLNRVHLKRRLQEAGQPVSRQRIHSWLAGTSVPSPDILPALCEALTLSASEAALLYTGSKIPLPAVLQPADTEVSLAQAA